MKPGIRIEPSFCIAGALALLLIPLRWMAAAFLAAAVHEGGHLLALRLLRVPVAGMSLGLGGARIETAPMGCREELISAAAGPIAGLLLVSFAQWLPCTAICALVQSVYNLLPMGHQDGGRILRCMLALVAGERAGVICRVVQGISGGGILLICLWLRLWILPVLLLGLGASEKFLAKVRIRRYNRADYG